MRKVVRQCAGLEVTGRGEATLSAESELWQITHSTEGSAAYS